MATREEILGKLYALRAGLSYIAAREGELKEVADYYNAYEKATKAGEKSNNSADCDFEFETDDTDVCDCGAISEQTKQRLVKIKKINNKLKYYRWRIKYCEERMPNYLKASDDNASYVKYEKNRIKRTLVALGVAIALLLCGILSIVSIANEWGWSGVFVGISVYGMLPVSVIAIFILILFVLLGQCYDLQKARSEQATFDSFVEGEKTREEDDKRIVERLTRELEQYKKEQPALYEKYKKVKAEAIAKTYPLYMTLKGEEGAIVSESDWENLDLIIYYFETGRATTVKEALFLVDRQKQTEAIVKAIENAGNQIAQTIATATYALMQTINAACTEICNNIKVVSGHLATISAGISSIAGGVSSLVDAAELQNALLSQANRSSADIAADVAYMRLEFEQKRRREGR